jgi:hypothetical protein
VVKHESRTGRGGVKQLGRHRGGGSLRDRVSSQGKCTGRPIAAARAGRGTRAAGAGAVSERVRSGGATLIRAAILTQALLALLPMKVGLRPAQVRTSSAHKLRMLLPARKASAASDDQVFRNGETSSDRPVPAAVLGKGGQGRKTHWNLPTPWLRKREKAQHQEMSRKFVVSLIQARRDSC